MNNRFSALSSDNSDNINSNKNNKTKVSKQNDVKPRENIFKQKPKPEKDQNRSSDQNRSRDQKKNTSSSSSTNQFKKFQQKIKQEFKIESENFPNLLNILETDDKKIDTAKELTYSEKIIQQKKSIEVENTVPNGWIILKKLGSFGVTKMVMN